MSSHNQSYLQFEIGKQFELDLANIIKGIAFSEISIENMKIKSAEDPHFDIFMAWESIDIYKKGQITPPQLSLFLGKNHTPCSEYESVYLINMISKGKEVLQEQEFIEWFLPYTNYNLKVLALRRRENNLQLRRIHNMDDNVVKQTSQKEASEILGSELGFYRDIDKLKQQFVKDHSYNIHDIFKCIEVNENGLFDYQGLKNFMKKLNILFNEEECLGFFYRCCAIDSHKKEISYEELAQSIIPNEPFLFKAYQNTFNSNDIQKYMLKKAGDFNFDVTPLSFGKKPPLEKKNMMQHFYPFRKCFDPYSTGKVEFNRDQGYMTELTHYNQTYFNPSKDNSCMIRNSNKNGGIRTHDHFYDRYYALLYDREKSEILYNKLGKKYVYDQKINDLKNDMQKGVSITQSRMRSHSSYNPNRTNSHIQKQSYFDPTDRINGNFLDHPANKKSTQPNMYTQESLGKGVYRDNTPTMRYGQKFSDDEF
ncbi:hypothetical protein ABPG74_006037 [Tetrahymena malaccensis]